MQGTPLSTTKLAESVTAPLIRYARGNTNLWLLDADLGDSYGFTPELLQAFDSRFIQSGIAEQNMVSVACGLAAMGKQPWVFSFSAFLVNRAYDQIRCGISQGGAAVTLVGANAGTSGLKNGNTHLCLNDISLLNSLPGIEIWAPCSQADLLYTMDQVMTRQRAAYIRLPKFATTTFSATVKQDWQWLTPPRGEVLLLSTGSACSWAQELVIALQQRGMPACHAHITRIKPLPDTLDAILNKGYRAIYTLEDHVCEGGFGDIVARHFPHLAIRRIGWPLTWFQVSTDAREENLRRQHAIDTLSLVKWIMEDIAPCKQEHP